MAFSRALASAQGYAEDTKAEMATDLETSKATMFSKLTVRPEAVNHQPGPPAFEWIWVSKRSSNQHLQVAFI
jgi:hypothetical protein